MAEVGWALTDLQCADPDNGTSFNLNTHTATIDLDAGETVICIFTDRNVRKQKRQVVVDCAACPLWVISSRFAVFPFTSAHGGAADEIARKADIAPETSVQSPI